MTFSEILADYGYAKSPITTSAIYAKSRDGMQFAVRHDAKTGTETAVEAYSAACRPVFTFISQGALINALRYGMG